MSGVHHGSTAILKLGTVSSETDISLYIDSITPNLFEYDEADTSVIGAFKKSIPGQYGSSIDFGGPWSSEIHAILQPLRGVTGKGFVYGPEGSTSTNYKTSGTGWLSYSVKDSSIGDAVRYEATFHIASAVTEGTF